MNLDFPVGEGVLRYRKPARKWTEALRLGNGRIGAMPFGGVADERIQLVLKLTRHTRVITAQDEDATFKRFPFWILEFTRNCEV